MAFESTQFQDARIDVGAVLSAIVRRLPLIIAITVALLALTFVYLMFQPRLYESSASILVEPRSNAYARASNEQAPTISGGEAGVVSSQIELLKSRDTLVTVIDQLDLRSNPEFNGSRTGFSPLSIVFQLMGRSSTPVSVDETVLGTLYDRLTVVQERDSRIISVLVRSTDPALAAAIANAVANAHVARRASLSISDTAEASGWLGTEINRLRVSVQEAESAVANFRVENDLFTGQNNTSLLDQQLSTISSQITDSQERKNAALSRATLIRGLIQRGQPIEGVADVRDSVVIQQLSQEKARLQGEKAQRAATLLPNHPTIRALTAQITELDAQLRAEGQRVADALEAEAQIEADIEASLQADLTRAKATASTATRDTVTLDSLQREAKAQRDLLEAYLLRYTEASSRVDVNSALPDVRVVSEAAPSVTPASPKSSLILTAVGLVSAIGQVGAVIFGELMSGRALRPVARRLVTADDDFDPQFDADAVEQMVAEEAVAPKVDAEVASDSLDEPEYAPEPEYVAEPEYAVEPDHFAEDDLEPVAAPVIPEALAVAEPAVPDEHDQREAERAFIRALMTSPRTAGEPGSDYEALEQFAVEEPVPAAAPRVHRARPEADTPTVLRYTELVSDLVLGRTHLVMIADHGPGNAGHAFAEDLVGDALAKGLSVALIDAGSGRPTDAPGLTDLCLGLASFGDVVQKSADNTFAEVTWGQDDGLDMKSTKPQTLAEALGDIYEVVVILTGRVGRRSALPLFAAMDGRVVVVADDRSDVEALDATRRRLLEAGMPRVDIAALNDAVAA